MSVLTVKCRGVKVTTFSMKIVGWAIVSVDTFFSWHFAHLWTSTTQSHLYLTFTCHFIDPHCMGAAIALPSQTHYMPEDHTAANVQEALSETLHPWKLAELQLVGITTNIGSNVKLACDLLKWKRLSCFGHNLNLAVEKGLSDARVQRVIHLCKSVVTTFS